jgi:hypothetical protein
MNRSVHTGAHSAGVLLLAVSFLANGCSKDSTGPSDAEEVRMNITATISYVSDSSTLLGGNFDVGDKITGYYVYDSTLEDSNTAETVGDYRHTTSPYGIFLNCNGFEFKTDLSDVNFLVELVNNHGTTPRDNYLLRSYNNVPLAVDLAVDHISWQLDDPTAVALESTELGTAPPVLEDWESTFGLTIEGFDPADEYTTYMIRAHVTACSKGG